MPSDGLTFKNPPLTFVCLQRPPSGANKHHQALIYVISGSVCGCSDLFSSSFLRDILWCFSCPGNFPCYSCPVAISCGVLVVVVTVSLITCVPCGCWWSYCWVTIVVDGVGNHVGVAYIVDSWSCFIGYSKRRRQIGVARTWTGDLQCVWLSDNIHWLFFPDYWLID